MKTFIIAEAGSNHDGEIKRAFELCEIAIDAKADAVKFQLIPPFEPRWIDALIDYCGKRIEFMASPFNENGVHALRGKVKHWKIASTEAANEDFVDLVLKAAKGAPVFISDGSVKYISSIALYDENITPMACVVKYPAKVEDYHLAYYRSIGKWGLSDHTTSTYFPSVAVALGASVVEKHFTDDIGREGPDHIYAQTPQQLEQMVHSIRATEKMLSASKLTVTKHVGRKLQWP